MGTASQSAKSDSRETEVVYRVEGLTKIYRNPPVVANKNINLEVARGSFVGIFGPNGAGKTTLVCQMAGLLNPTQGNIFLYGYNVVREPWRVPYLVGYYGQKVLALRAHKLHEVLYIAGLLRGQRRIEARQQARELIRRFELGALADRVLDRLSGGEQRLAALLSTFMGNPPVLILDEPTNELDPLRRRLLWEYLWGSRDEHGTTIIFVTHNLLEAETVVERVVFIDRGEVQAMGTPGELKRLVEDSVRLEVRLRGSDTMAVSWCDEKLRAIPGSERVRAGVWRIVAPRCDAVKVLQKVVAHIGPDALDDFRLVIPTLEDVYLRLTGRRWAEEHES